MTATVFVVTKALCLTLAAVKFTWDFTVYMRVSNVIV